MSLLRDIQEAIDSEADLPVILRKCKILATRLGHEQLKKWVDQELNGYKSRDDLPDYRVFKTFSLGQFVGAFGGGWDNVPITPSIFPEELKEYRWLVDTEYLMESVSHIQSVVNGATSNILTEPWPPEIVRVLSQRVSSGHTLVSAWRVVPKAVLVNLIDTIRTRILNFVLEIEELAPEAGEAKPGERPLPESKVTQVFITNITRIGSMTHSQLQQGTDHSIQASRTIPLEPSAVTEFVGRLEGNLDELHLPRDVHSQLQAEIGTIEAQLSSSRPKRDYVVGSLETIRTVLNEVQATIADPAVIATYLALSSDFQQILTPK